MTPKQRLRLALMGLAAAVVLVGLSALVIDYPAMFRGMWDRIWPVDVSTVQIELGTFGEYVEVVDRTTARSFDNRQMLVLRLKRQAAFPLDAAAVEKLLAERGETLAGRLTVEALARGYVRCECFDTKGQFYGSVELRLTGLRTAETIDVAIPLPTHDRLARAALVY
jgi:hypothetical protein